MGEEINNVDPLNEWRAASTMGDEMQRPDGRPLYRYRLSSADFVGLEAALRLRLNRLRSLDEMAQGCVACPKYFVLYAAEWWRRCYDGGQLTWQRILSELHAEHMPWSPMRRGACIDKGLRAWRLDTTRAGGLRYLRAIALQGGLPLALLAEARGPLGTVLSRVLATCRDHHPTPELLRDWVASLGDRLPHLYRQEEIYDLLAGVISTVLELVGELDRTAPASAIQQLDARDPDWRDRFPLPVEHGAARGLIDQLIREGGAGITPRNELVVARWIERSEGGPWRLFANLALPERIAPSDLRGLFHLPEGEVLPRTWEFRLEVGKSTATWRGRRLAGHDLYKIDAKPSLIDGDDAAQAFLVRLTTADGGAWMAAPRRSEALNEDMPWLFEETTDHKVRLLRQGGGGVRTEHVLVAIPTNWRVSPLGTATAECIGDLDLHGRRLYRSRGVLLVQAPDGSRWRVSSAQAGAAESDFHWEGSRAWDGFVSPSMAFRDLPRLYDGIQAIPPGALRWRPTAVSFGPLMATCEQRGEFVHRDRLVHLPPLAGGVRINPLGPSEGELHFEGWQVASATVVNGSGIEAQCSRNGATLVLHLKAHAQEGTSDVAPEWVDLSLIWPSNPSQALLRLPFPARGVRAFDAHDRPLAEDSWLTVHRLLGVRLVAIGLGRQIGLRLELRHTRQPGPALHADIPLRSNDGSGRIEIRLSDHREDMERLLAADELLDAWIQVSLCAGPQDWFKLRVSRYLCPLVREPDSVALTPNGLRRLATGTLSELSVLALRLEDPAEEPELLPPRLSEGVPSGAWSFDPNERDAGSWLIYPAIDAPEQFRPTLWTIPGEKLTESPLSAALGIEDQHAREAALDGVIGAMARDYTEPCWPQVERLAAHLGHLPLGSLDLWRCFARNPAAMAALSLRMHPAMPSAYAEKFAAELPFLWELIPLETWWRASEHLWRQCTAWLPDALWRRELERHLKAVEEALTARHPALQILLGIIRCKRLMQPCPGITAIPNNPALDAELKRRLSVGQDTDLNLLLTNHPVGTWPSDNWLRQRIQASAGPEGNWSALFVDQFLRDAERTSIVNLPILLAIEAVTGQSLEWFGDPRRIHQIRCHRAFDPDWFETAFDLTVARCLARGVLDLAAFD